MNEALALTAIAVMAVFCLWIVLRLSKQQRDGTLHHPEDERLREDADTRDVETRLVDIPWREGGQHPVLEPLPATAAPDAITEPAVLLVRDEAAEAAAGGDSRAGREPAGATEAWHAGWRPSEAATNGGAPAAKADEAAGAGAEDAGRRHPASRS